MAGVNIKTDFKNGDKLMDHQLNNNFKAIMEALNTMNSIVWQDNAEKVIAFRGTTEELANRQIINGQLLYDLTTGSTYIDYDNKRVQVGAGAPPEIFNSFTESSDGAYSSDYINNNYYNKEEVYNKSDVYNKEEVYNKLTIEDFNTYSTEETFTGKYWIDGKKIYRKVITDVNINSATEHNISNFNEIIDAYGSIKLSTGTFQLINRASNAENYHINIGGFNSTTFTLQAGTAYEISSSNVILEYTKTKE